MVIAPLSLIFVRVPSCAAGGTAMASASAARIRVIGRVMSVSLWPFESAAGWVGEAAGFYGSPPFLVQAAAAARGARIRSPPPEGTRHEPRADAHRARSPGRPGGPRRRLLRHPYAARVGELSHHGDGDLDLPGAGTRARLRQAGGGAREQCPRTAPRRQGRCDRASLRGAS